MLLNFLKNIPIFWDMLNKTPLKRIIIYCALLTPIYIVTTFRNEISFLLTPTSKNVVVENLADAQNKCYSLRIKYDAEAVLVYIYQPSGREKSYKERMFFSSENYKPISSMKMVNLFSRADIITDLKKKGYCEITQKSNHYESSILTHSKLSVAYITPIYDNVTNEMIGEVAWLFKEQPTKLNVETLRIESQIFSYDIIE